MLLVELEIAYGERPFSFPNTYQAVRSSIEELNRATTLSQLYDTTAVAVAHDGEWTRRRVPGIDAARQWGNKVGIPVYDVALVGYPKRMREFNERRKQAEQS